MARTPVTTPFDGRLLRAARKNRGWRQEDLAARCTEQGTPVSRFQVARAEIGLNMPLVATLEAFARALEVNLDDLMADEIAIDDLMATHRPASRVGRRRAAERPQRRAS